MTRRRMTKSIRRGLLYWSGHCQSILDDKLQKHNDDTEAGHKPEFTKHELADLCDAVSYMAEHGEP